MSTPIPITDTTCKINWTDYESEIRERGIPYSPSIYGQEYNYIDKLIEAMKEGSNPYEIMKYDRSYFIKKYSFAIPNEEALLEICKHSPILEIGCGSGYWAYELRKKGCDIVATDKYEWYKDKEDGVIKHHQYGFHYQWIEVIERIDALEAIEKYPERTLMLCWPSCGEGWAARALKHYKGDKLIYIGEWGDACGDDEMVKILDRDYEEYTCIRIPIWYGIHDALWVLNRKPTTQKGK